MNLRFLNKAPEGYENVIETAKNIVEKLLPDSINGQHISAALSFFNDDFYNSNIGCLLKFYIRVDAIFINNDGDSFIINESYGFNIDIPKRHLKNEGFIEMFEKRLENNCKETIFYIIDFIKRNETEAEENA